jgi:hypothetical protein
MGKLEQKKPILMWMKQSEWILKQKDIYQFAAMGSCPNLVN